MLTIQQLTLNQIESYLDHLARHYQEYGPGGILSHPFPVDQPFNREMFRKRIQNRWQETVGKGDWEVAFGLMDGEKIVGHLDLIGNGFPALSHRVNLGMGLETKYRGQGYARKLMITALDFARELSLEWIDLNVLAHNRPAISLYESFHFQLVGRTTDRLRVNGQSIDDLHLTLKLNQDRVLPLDYKIQEVSAEKFKTLVSPHEEAVYAQTLGLWVRDLLTKDEKAKLQQLNENSQKPFQLFLVLMKGDELAGWTCGHQDSRESFCMADSAVLPAHQGKGLYSYLLEQALEMIIQKGFQRIWSAHLMTQNNILIPKLKRGFVLTGTQFNVMAGALVVLTYFVNPKRRKLIEFRTGQTRPDPDLKALLKI